MKKWFVEEGDVREDEVALGEAVAFFREHGVKRVANAQRVLGCPHEEPVDYEGEFCPDPACAFWVGVDRWTGERR